MRDIKFRAKRRSAEKEWIYGGLKTFSDGSVTIHDERVGAKDFTGLEYPCDWETVGQFTGLLDKNGVEIYEGDIVKNDHQIFHIFGVVEYATDEAGFRVRTSPESQEKADYLKLAKELPFKWMDIEVIGNIYQNPELLSQPTKEEEN